MLTYRVRVAPEYPPSAIARGTEGWVQVQFYNPRIEGGEAVERVGVQTVIRFDLD